jgi:hypothetical protein
MIAPMAKASTVAIIFSPLICLFLPFFAQRLNCFGFTGLVAYFADRLLLGFVD